MKQSDNISFWSRIERKVKWLDRYGVVAVGVLVTFATVLWFFGLKGSPISRLLQAPFYALQFIVLNKDVAGKVSEPWIKVGLYITQFAIPFFAYGTFFTKLFDERIHPKLKRKTVENFRGHHVIVSYGAFGKALKKALSDYGNTQIVAVDKQYTAEHDNESTMTILYFDALRDDLFNEANLKSASRLYLMLPDERDNLSLLEKIKNSAEPGANFKVYLRNESFAMQNLIMDWVGINAAKQDGLDIRASNPYAVAARGIVNQYSPDLYAPTMKGSVAQVVMIIGVSEMASALVLRFARIGTYSPNGKLRLVWVGEGVTEAFNELKTLYPALDTDYRDLDYWSLESEVSREFFDSVLPPINLALVDQPAGQAIRTGAFAGADVALWPSVIYVCHDSDIRNLAEARDIQAALCSKPEAARIKVYGKKGRLILAIQNESKLGIADNQALLAFPYRIEEQCIDALFAKTVVEDRADDIAKEYHAVYFGLKDEVKIKEAWIRMPVYWKESNRDLADHLAIKARYAGVSAETVDELVFKGVGSISEEDEDKMRKAFYDLINMEIYRYRAFMFMNGFMYGTHASEYLERIDELKLEKPEKELDQCLRVNKTLLQKELPDDERKKDGNIVNKSIELLKQRRNYQ